VVRLILLQVRSSSHRFLGVCCIRFPLPVLCWDQISERGVICTANCGHIVARASLGEGRNVGNLLNIFVVIFCRYLDSNLT